MKTQSFYKAELFIYHKMKYTQLMEINEFWFSKAAVEILKVIHSFFFQVPLFLVIICFFVQLGHVKFLGKVIMTE